jgi:pimeloyl-ACP methyl ester carboxylesterase
MPHLCRRRRVIAFDIAGFGSTPPLPKGTLPTIPNLAEAFGQSLREIGLTLPVDFAGNSLGGSIALEAARRGIARSVVAISPPGLWKAHPAPHVKHVFRSLRLMAGSHPQIVKATMRIPWLRELVLAVPISVGSRRMAVNDALRAIEDLATSTAFEETFENTRLPLSGVDITVPLTVDPHEGLEASRWASGAHQVGRQARLGPRTHVGRSRRCLATHPAEHRTALTFACATI